MKTLIQPLYALVLLIGLFGCSDEDKRIQTVADVYSSDVGSEAVITGVVIVESGLYDGFLTKGFAVSEDSGGLYIVTDEVASVSRGNSVTVTGKVEDLHSMKVLHAKSIEVGANKKGHESNPISLSPNQFDEFYVGKVATVEAQVIALKPDLPYGWRLELTDRAGGSARVEAVIASTSKIDPRGDSRFRKGANVTVTGFMVLFKNKVYILPRDGNDLVFQQAE